MWLPPAISAFQWLENAIGGEAWTYPAIVAAAPDQALLTDQLPSAAPA